MAVARLFPVADGNYGSTWTKFTGCGVTDVWQAIDEDPNNGDTDYAVSDDSTTGGSSCGALTGPVKGSYRLQPPSLIEDGSTINSVTIHAVVKKSPGTLAVTFRVGVREAGTDSFGSTAGVTSAYVDVSAAFTSRPGGSAWNKGSVEAMEAIIESVSIALAEECRVTQVYADVNYTPPFLSAQGVPFQGIDIATVGGPITRTDNQMIREWRDGNIAHRLLEVWFFGRKPPFAPFMPREATRIRM